MQVKGQQVPNVGRQGLGIKRGDEVVVISGDDSNRRGEVLRVLRAEGKLVVQGVNMVTRHRRGGRRTSVQQMQSGRIEMPAPLDVSNVRLVCPRCDRPTTVRYVASGEGVRTRACKKCQETLDDV
jgi:large subunit ribosomal protein L24